MSVGAIKLSVRPVFVGWITLLTQLPVQLFFTLWATLFFGGMLTSTGLLAKSSWSAFYVIGVFVFFAIPIVAYVGKKLNYSQTEYRFYPDRLEFDEGFFSVNKKVIKFRDVKETRCARASCSAPVAWARSISRRWRLVRLEIPIPSWRSASAMFRPAGSSCAISATPTTPSTRYDNWWMRRMASGGTRWAQFASDTTR
jgi:hypothetical protein